MGGGSCSCLSCAVRLPFCCRHCHFLCFISLVLIDFPAANHLGFLSYSLCVFQRLALFGSTMSTDTTIERHCILLLLLSAVLNWSRWNWYEKCHTTIAHCKSTRQDPETVLEGTFGNTQGCGNATWFGARRYSWWSWWRSRRIKKKHPIRLSSCVQRWCGLVVIIIDNNNIISVFVIVSADHFIGHGWASRQWHSDLCHLRLSVSSGRGDLLVNQYQMSALFSQGMHSWMVDTACGLSLLSIAVFGTMREWFEEASALSSSPAEWSFGRSYKHQQRHQ